MESLARAPRVENTALDKGERAPILVADRAKAAKSSYETFSRSATLIKTFMNTLYAKIDIRVWSTLPTTVFQTRSIAFAWAKVRCPNGTSIPL